MKIIAEDGAFELRILGDLHRWGF